MDDSAVGDGPVDARLAVVDEELRVAAEELRAQQEHIDELVRSRAADRAAMSQLASALPVPLLDTDATGVVTGANTAAGELLRLGPTTLAGKPIMAFVAVEDRRRVRAALSQAVAGRGAQHFNAHLQPRKAAVVLADVAIVPAPAAEGPDPVLGRSVAARWVVAPHGAGGATAEPAVLDALAELASLTVGTSDLHSALDRVAALAVRGVAGAGAATLLVGSPAAPDVVVTTGPLAQAGDGLQHRAGQGPAWDAYRTGTAVATERLGADRRWPRLAGCAGASLGGALVVPVPGADAGEPVAGVLAIYGSEVLALGEGPARRAAMFADAAAAVLREHKVVAELRALESQLREALESRAVIDQAKGIVMARLGCGPDEAFAELVRQSQVSNVKLRVVAAQVVSAVATGRPVG